MVNMIKQGKTNTYNSYLLNTYFLLGPAQALFHPRNSPARSEVIFQVSRGIERGKVTSQDPTADEGHGWDLNQGYRPRVYRKRVLPQLSALLPPHLGFGE